MRTCQIMDFAVPEHHKVKIKESEKGDRPFQRINKKQWNIKMTALSLVIGAFRTILKRLVIGHEDLEVRGQIETTHHY